MSVEILGNFKCRVVIAQLTCDILLVCPDNDCFHIKFQAKQGKKIQKQNASSRTENELGFFGGERFSL